MKRLELLLLFTLILASTSFGQSDSKDAKKQNSTIIGTWRLIEFSDLDTISGQWIHRYGKNPRGYFTYTKTGIVNLNISTDSPMRISEDSAKKYSVNLFDYLKTNALGYFGTYTVEVTKSVVMHHVKGGSLPWYIDTDQPRPFILKGDTLIIGDNKTSKRMLVRVD